MQSMFEVLEKKEVNMDDKTKNVGERHEIVGLIFNKLKATSFKKIRIEWLGKILSKFKTPDLYAFHKECMGANNYAALFWTLIKKK